MILALKIWRVRGVIYPSDMPETPDVILREYLKLAEDGLCISDPVYGRDTFEAMVDDYFRANNFEDWNSGNIRIAKNIKYDAEKRRWIARIKVKGDKNWYSIYGLENGLIWFRWDT